MKCSVCKKSTELDHTKCQYVEKFRCMCGCNRCFSLKDLKHLDLKPNDRIKCRRKKSTCSQCQKQVDFLIQSLSNDVHNLRLCIQCVEKNHTDYLNEKHRWNIQMELYQKDADAIGKELEKHKEKYEEVMRAQAAFYLYSLYGRHYELGQASEFFLKKYQELTAKHTNLTREITTLTDKIHQPDLSLPSYKIVRYIMTVLMLGNRIGLPKGITHWILIYVISGNKAITISNFYRNKYK